MCIIGMMDNIIGWKTGTRQCKKPLFLFFADRPMMISANFSIMDLLIVIRINGSILYPL